MALQSVNLQKKSLSEVVFQQTNLNLIFWTKSEYIGLKYKSQQPKIHGKEEKFMGEIYLTI